MGGGGSLSSEQETNHPLPQKLMASASSHLKQNISCLGDSLFSEQGTNHPLFSEQGTNHPLTQKLLAAASSHLKQNISGLVSEKKLDCGAVGLYLARKQNDPLSISQPSATSSHQSEKESYDEHIGLSDRELLSGYQIECVPGKGDLYVGAAKNVIIPEKLLTTADSQLDSRAEGSRAEGLFVGPGSNHCKDNILSASTFSPLSEKVLASAFENEPGCTSAFVSECQDNNFLLTPKIVASAREKDIDCVADHCVADHLHAWQDTNHFKCQRVSTSLPVTGTKSAITNHTNAATSPVKARKAKAHRSKVRRAKSRDKTLDAKCKLQQELKSDEGIPRSSTEESIFVIPTGYPTEQDVLQSIHAGHNIISLSLLGEALQVLKTAHQSMFMSGVIRRAPPAYTGLKPDIHLNISGFYSCSMESNHTWSAKLGRHHKSPISFPTANRYTIQDGCVWYHRKRDAVSHLFLSIILLISPHKFQEWLGENHYIIIQRSGDQQDHSALCVIFNHNRKVWLGHLQGKFAPTQIN